jgi:hypothetical protein
MERIMGGTSKPSTGKAGSSDANRRPNAEVVISAAEQLLNDGKTDEATATLLVGILRELGALRADIAASRTGSAHKA